jgi:hypothetical protein
MAAPEEINADMLAFWNGRGGHTWVARQEHTDITLTPVTNALLGFASPRAGERVVAATPDARMAIVCWRTLAENPWMEVPMTAVAQHLPPRLKPVPSAPGMFAFADPEHVTEVLTESGWASPHFEKLDIDLDIAAGRGLEEAVVQSTEIGAVNSWLRNQPAQVISAAIASLREALAPYADGVSVRLRGAMWLIGSAPA